VIARLEKYHLVMMENI